MTQIKTREDLMDEHINASAPLIDEFDPDFFAEKEPEIHEHYLTGLGYGLSAAYYAGDDEVLDSAEESDLAQYQAWLEVRPEDDWLDRLG